MGNKKGWIREFCKHYPRKCLIGRIEISNEVNNDWKSCKKEPLSMQSIIIVPTFWTLACAKVSSSPLIYRSIHFRISMSMFLNHLFCWIFKVVLPVILHLPLIKSVCWPLKSMKHDNPRQRHQASISNSNFGRKICQWQTYPKKIFIYFSSWQLYWIQMSFYSEHFPVF